MRKIINAAAMKSKASESSIRKKLAPLLGSLKASIKKLKVNASVTVGGSLAKGTLLKDDFDIDLFVVFDKKYRNEELSTHLRKILRNAKLRYGVIHGSRDYFGVKVEGINVEVVPVLKVKNASEALNVTDMSPLHVKWIRGNLNEKIQGDIRAAKLFCKSHRIYGAESYVRGFSGHVLDILVTHYKGLDKLFNVAAKWKLPIVVDPEKHYKGKALLLMNKSKLGPLVVVDPVDASRNAAAAVNEASLKTFIREAKRFIKKPSSTFFSPFKFDLEKLTRKHKKNNLVLVTPEVTKGKEDVVGAKLLKAFERLKGELVSGGFSLKDSGWFWDGDNFALYWYATPTELLPKTRLHGGPFSDQPEHCKTFKKKYPNARKSRGRLVAPVKVEHRTAQECLKHALKGSKADILVNKR